MGPLFISTNVGSTGSGGNIPIPNDDQNIGLATSVAANALTIALKQQDGATDPTTAGPVIIGFRSSTASSGAFNLRTVNAALSIVVPNGATLGLLSGSADYIYVYALDNAGTVELAVSGQKQTDDGSVYTTTTIGAGSTSANLLYSTTGRAAVPVRLIGRLKITATAGAYASNATEVSLTPFTYLTSTPTVQRFTSGTAQTYTTPANVKYIRVRMIGGGGGGGGSCSSGTTTNGSTGTASTFGTSLLTCNPGVGNVAQAGGLGGTATIAAPAIGLAISGGAGGSGSQTAVALTYVMGGQGGQGPFAGNGSGGPAGTAATNALANTGAGGGGGGSPVGNASVSQSAGGGGSGGYVDAIIYNPAATYTYTVGPLGAKGAAGTGGTAGGDGSAGLIIVEEYYN